MGTLSEDGCQKLMMQNVFEQCKINKWGDDKQWKRKFIKYKETMDKILGNNRFIARKSIDNIPITSSMISDDTNIEDIKNNIKYQYHDLQKSNKIPPEAYIMFDLSRIENEISDKCIYGRNKLKINYPNFEFVGSKNILRLIQSIKINQQVIKFETWRLFDGQFESNSQRKKALIVIEEVIGLIVNSTGNQNISYAITDEMLDEDDDKSEDKEDVKNDIYDGNEELWHFMEYKLKMPNTTCGLFKFGKVCNLKQPRVIQLKHIKSLWH